MHSRSKFTDGDSLPLVGSSRFWLARVGQQVVNNVGTRKPQDVLSSLPRRVRFPDPYPAPERASWRILERDKVRLGACLGKAYRPDWEDGMLVCQHCGTQNTDPGGPPEYLSCGQCGGGPLVRVPDPAPDNTGKALAAGAVGVAVGGAIGGPIGAAIGGLLGALIGSKL